MSTFIQFDGEIDDPDKLKQELKASGINILNVHRSRWKSETDEDRGGRIDIEVETELAPTAQKVTKLEAVMKANKTWKKKTDGV